MLRDQIKKVMGEIFGLAPGEIPDTATMEELEVWDSLNQMELMLAVEIEFGVRDVEFNVLPACEANARHHVVPGALAVAELKLQRFPLPIAMQPAPERLVGGEVERLGESPAPRRPARVVVARACRLEPGAAAAHPTTSALAVIEWVTPGLFETPLFSPS